MLKESACYVLVFLTIFSFSEVNMLIHMLDYHLWIKYIFELKKTTEIKEDYDETDERWKVTLRAFDCSL